MKKVFLSLTVGLLLSLYSSENFEDKHFKCTLGSKGYEDITERQAESLNEFNIDVLITKTDLKIGYKTFKFEKVEDGIDIYSGGVYQKAYILYQTLYIDTVSDTVYDTSRKEEQIRKSNDEYRNREKRLRYDCTEATFIQKAKYKYDNF